MNTGPVSALRLMRRSLAVADRLDLEDALIDWYVVWLPDAKEAAKRDKCPRNDYITMHKPKARVDAARAYDAVQGGAWPRTR